MDASASFPTTGNKQWVIHAYNLVQVSSSDELLKVCMKDMITKINEDIKIKLSAHKEDSQMFKEEVKADIKEIKESMEKLVKHMEKFFQT